MDHQPKSSAWAGRGPWLRPDELDDTRRRLYDSIAGGPRASGIQAFPLTDEEGRLHGPFNAMLYAPAVGSALQELGAAIRYGTSLSDRIREIAILTVARVRRSEFEWYAHVRVGRLAGLTEPELEALRTGEAPPRTFSEAETVAHDAVVELLRTRDLGLDSFHITERALGTAGLQELIVLVGYYDLLALSMQVWRTPLPQDEPLTFDSSPTTSPRPSP